MRILVVAFALSMSVAHATETEPWNTHLDGAALAHLRWRVGPMGDVLHRLAVDHLPVMRTLSAQLGIDPLDPKVLVPTGIDPSAPIELALFEAVRGKGYVHHRAVAVLAHRDRLVTFLAGAASAKRAHVVLSPRGSVEERAHILATVSWRRGVAILRNDGNLLVVDVAQIVSGAAPRPRELATRFPLLAKSAPPPLDLDGAAALSVDSRKLAAAMPALAHWIVDAPKERALARCQSDWSRTNAIFDRFGAALSSDGQGTQLRVQWRGSQQRLQLRASDDGAIDAASVMSGAVAAVHLPLTSLLPFQALDSSKLPSLRDESTCRSLGQLAIALRHWPQALGRMLDDAFTGAPGSPSSITGTLFGQLRNVTLLWRDLKLSGSHYAFCATFEKTARPAVELFFANVGKPETLSFGGRAVDAYPMNVMGLSNGFLALTDLSTHDAVDRPLLVVASDSTDSIGWVLTPPPRKVEHPPLGTLHVDAAAIGRLLAATNPESAPFWQAVARAGTVDGTITGDEAGIQVTLSAPLR